MSKSLISAFAIAGLLFCGAIYAEEGAKPADGAKAGAEAHKGIAGTVVSYADNKLVISVKNKDHKDGVEQTIATNDKTTVTGSDDKKTLADLKAGDRVSVIVENDVAVKVEVRTMHKKEGEKKEGGNEKKEH